MKNNRDTKKLSLRTDFKGPKAVAAADLLAELTGLSKMRIKDAMNKGAVWILRKKGGLQRLRRASADLKPGTHIELYYDEELLSLKPPEASCLHDQGHYSVWLKPAGLLSQGTKYGDHCSLLRQAELYFGLRREVWLIHRLDREASGLMLIAHTKDAAGVLSELFRKDLIVKKYRLEVLGDLTARGKSGTIDLPLDDKPAVTDYEAGEYDPARNLTPVVAVIRTGRLHQIRRHFDMIGFPVIGDPQYGTGNKNRTGMKLEAVSLSFLCPYRNENVAYTIEKDSSTF
ncbi:MAG: RluA family pseudouridine synthase [Nitrospirae bacterium]|nr:MAG: RluA family pseudouridine synthase [Nitrospirota bacterium]